MTTTATILDRRSQCFQLPGAATLNVRRAGVLRVPSQAGSAVWLTVDGEAQDRVLQPGDSLALDRGHRIVIEAWRPGDAAQLSWQAALPAPVRRAPLRAWEPALGV